MTPSTRLMVEQLKALSEQGLGYADAAWALNARPKYVANLAKKHGISFKLERRGPKTRDEGRVSA